MHLKNSNVQHVPNAILVNSGVLVRLIGVMKPTMTSEAELGDSRSNIRLGCNSFM